MVFGHPQPAKVSGYGGQARVFLTKILEDQAIGEGKVWRVGQSRMRSVEKQEANCHIPKDRAERKAEGRERKGGFRRTWSWILYEKDPGLLITSA